MRIRPHHRVLTAASVGLITLGAGLGLAGCAATGGKAPAKQASGEASSKLSGAKVWANNCTRCHNLRQPKAFSDVQWEVVSRHMRVRANLTGNQERAVRAFLQKSN